MAAATGVVLIALGAVSTKAAVINFDTDANGDPIDAPPFFVDATQLIDLYAPLGVRFSGPSGNNGGAILNQDGNFGVDARSGENFLAFNREIQLGDGVFTDPETISFDTPLTRVSIFASGGFDRSTFQLDAFDINNLLVGSSVITAPPGTYRRLSVSSTSGDISQVILTETGVDDAFVYDDLSFTPVPEPSSVLSTLAGAFGTGWMLKRRQRKLWDNRLN